MTDKIKIVEPNHGQHIAFTGDIYSILAFKDDTGGTYSLIEAKVFPDGGPGSHIQTREHEGFYIIDGTITFNVEGKEIIAKSGTFVNVPPNASHSFKNNTDAIAKMLIVLAPGGMENLFIEAGKKVLDTTIKPSPMTEEDFKNFSRLFSKYGVKLKH
jgi:quercetin dioxygenase-like cupin family protein